MLIVRVAMSEDETFDPHGVGITFVPENFLAGLDEKDKRDTFMEQISSYL